MEWKWYNADHASQQYCDHLAILKAAIKSFEVVFSSNSTSKSLEGFVDTAQEQLKSYTEERNIAPKEVEKLEVTDLNNGVSISEEIPDLDAFLAKLGSNKGT